MDVGWSKVEHSSRHKSVSLEYVLSGVYICCGIVVLPVVNHSDPAIEIT